MELIRKTRKFGNSAGVLLPKHWLGYEVKITVVKRPRNIRRGSLKHLEPYLSEIIGIFLCGSYSREDQDLKSDINIMAVSSGIDKQLNIDKYNITLIPLKKIKQNLSKSIHLYMMLKESKALTNKLLLHDLRKIKLTKQAVESYSLNIKKSISNLKENKENLTSTDVFELSKELFILNCIITKTNYKKSDIFNFLSAYNPEVSKKLFLIYTSIRKNKKIKIKQKDLDEILIFFTKIHTELSAKI